MRPAIFQLQVVDHAAADTVAFNKIAAGAFTKTITPVEIRLDRMVESVIRRPV